MRSALPAREASPQPRELTGDGRHAPAPRLSTLNKPEHWDRFFAKADPWNYSSDYEQQKYRHTLELLPSRGIHRAAELGCAEGMFTELLAPRVESLVAADISATALERARARCSAHPHVAFMQHDISVGMPGDDYDLVVCSEILYYLRDRAAVERFVGEIYRALRPGGYVLTTHATMVSDDRSVTGFDFNEIGAATIGEVFSQQPGLDFERELRTDLYRVQLFRRTEAAIPASSVARSPGAPRETLVRANAKYDGSLVKWGGCVVTEAEARHCWLTEDVPVLMYHRVADDGPSALAPYRVSCADFERQLAWLQRYGYHGVTLEHSYKRGSNERSEPFQGNRSFSLSMTRTRISTRMLGRCCGITALRQPYSCRRTTSGELRRGIARTVKRHRSCHGSRLRGSALPESSSDRIAAATGA